MKITEIKYGRSAKIDPNVRYENFDISVDVTVQVEEGQDPDEVYQSAHDWVNSHVRAEVKALKEEG